MSSFNYYSCIPNGLKLLDGPENIRGLIADRNFKAGEIVTCFGGETVISLSKDSFVDNCSNCGGAIFSNDMIEKKYIYCPCCKALIHKSCFIYHNSEFQCRVLSSSSFNNINNHQTFIAVSQMALKASNDINYYNKLKFLVSHVDKFRKYDDGRYYQFEDLADSIIQLYKISNLSREEITIIACIFAINSFNIIDGCLNSKGMGFDFIVSLLNHCCIPNCYIMCCGVNGLDNNSNFILIALRDINSDDQITISYTNIFDNFKQRNETLNYYFFFSCTCQLCNGIELSLTDCFQCPNCFLLIKGLECKCGYHVDMIRYIHSTISTELFLKEYDCYLFNHSYEKVNIKKLLICLRLFLSFKDIPHTRQPIISLFDLLERYYITTKSIRYLCLLYFIQLVQTNLLIDIHLHSGLGVPILVSKLKTFVYHSMLYLNENDIREDYGLSCAIHTVSKLVLKYLQVKLIYIHCPKLRNDILTLNIPDQSIYKTMDELDAFQSLSLAFLELVFGESSSQQYEGVIENYTIALYIKIISGCDNRIYM